MPFTSSELDFTRICQQSVTIQTLQFTIQDIVVTTKRANVPSCDLGETPFGLPWHEPRTFRIRFTPGKASDYVRERIWADSQRIEEHEDGSITLEITTRSEPELMAWVRSFGKEAFLEEDQTSK